MAIVTYTISTISDTDGTQCTWQYDYDDATLRISAFRCINGTIKLGVGALIRQTDRLLYSQSFPPDTSFISIPTTPAARLQLIQLRPGRLDGVDVSFRLA